MSEPMLTVICDPCPVCGKQAQVRMPVAAAERWRAGALLQEAWPDGAPDLRELLISGTHSYCWDRLYGEEV